MVDITEIQIAGGLPISGNGTVKTINALLEEGLDVRNADAQLVPKGHFQVTVTGSAQDLAALIATSIPSGARLAQIQPETGDIRFRDDGTNPTASVGLKIKQDVTWQYNGSLAAIKLISTTGSVTTSIAFYG